MLMVLSNRIRLQQSLKQLLEQRTFFVSEGQIHCSIAREYSSKVLHFKMKMHSCWCRVERFVLSKIFTWKDKNPEIIHIYISNIPFCFILITTLTVFNPGILFVKVMINYREIQSNMRRWPPVFYAHVFITNLIKLVQWGICLLPLKLH